MSRALMTDLYQLTMLAGYYEKGMHDDNAVFEMFVRKLPKDRGYLIAAGLEQAVEYLTNLKFTKDEITYLKALPQFKHVSSGFWDYLSNFKFTGTLRAVQEGTHVFAEEPLLSIEAPLGQAQLVETYLLSTINFQTMIATKAARIVDAAQGKPVIDFGTRRAHGPEAGLYAARAAYIGGCVATSNVEAGRRFGIPINGTMAHSWVMSHDDEQKAFEDYADVFPETTIALIDTYNVEEGAKKAARLGKKLKGVRLDSGDLVEDSKKVRKILDEAGLSEAKIYASNDLNEWKIAELLAKGAPIDGFGVGTELVTSKDAPALGGVYKLVEDETGPRMKHSSEKATLPGAKQVYRVSDIEMDGLAYVRDVIALKGEFDSKEFYEKLLETVIENGKFLENLRTLTQARAKVLNEKRYFVDDIFRLNDSIEYDVVKSQGLQKLIEQLTLKKQIKEAAAK